MLQEGLFVPVDAELVPDCWRMKRPGPRSRPGVLPNGRVLGFEPAGPVKLAELLDAGERAGVLAAVADCARLAEHIHKSRLTCPRKIGRPPGPGGGHQPTATPGEAAQFLRPSARLFSAPEKRCRPANSSACRPGCGGTAGLAGVILEPTDEDLWANREAHTRLLRRFRGKLEARSATHCRRRGRPG